MRKSTIAKWTFATVMLATVTVPQIASQATTKTTAVTTTTIKVARHIMKKKMYVPLVSETMMAMWRKVNICEEGGRWNVRGSLYSGGLGITNANWIAFGGEALFGPAWAATPMQQVFIAERIQKRLSAGAYVPDQYGCGHGW